MKKFSEYYRVDSKNGLSKTFVDDVSGVRIVNMKELFGYNPITDDTVMRIVQLSDNELGRFALENDDLLFGRRSLVAEGAGKAAIYKGKLPTVFESSIIRVRLDKSKANPDFVNYYFNSPVGRGAVLSIITGAAVFGIRGSDLQNLKVTFPDIQTQQKIASILSAYDDLIENNNARIKLLEEMAEEIYKEWFVRLRFPDYENVKVVDGVPEGWKKEKIGNLLEPVKRKPKVKKDEYLQEGKFPIIDQGEGIIAGYTNDKEYVQEQPLPLLVFGDHTRRVKFIDYPFAAGADGTQLLSPKNKKLLPIYFFLAVKRVDLSNFHYSRHFKFLKQEYIIVPDDSTLEKYNDITSPFYKEIEVLRAKNKTLQQTRNLLLPRLISGKLSVEDINIEYPENQDKLNMAAEPTASYK